jgi:hypothetical protein
MATMQGNTAAVVHRDIEDLLFRLAHSKQSSGDAMVLRRVAVRTATAETSAAKSGFGGGTEKRRKRKKTK